MSESPMTMTPSAPTPKWRSHMARASPGVMSLLCTSRKSLPQPWYLENWRFTGRNGNRPPSPAGGCIGEPAHQTLGIGLEPLHARVGPEPRELPAGVAAGPALRLRDGFFQSHLSVEVGGGLRVD